MMMSVNGGIVRNPPEPLKLQRPNKSNHKTQEFLSTEKTQGIWEALKEKIQQLSK